LDPLWKTTLANVAEQKNVKVIFTCERHAMHGVGDRFNDPNTQIIPLTCVAMANPKLVAQALEAGASEVQFIGCPPEDCANREGNTWMNDRLNGERLPKLKPAFIPLVQTIWAAPTDFGRALRTKVKAEADTFKFMPGKSHLRFILALLGLMAIVMAIQLWLSNRPVAFYGERSASLVVQMTHHSGYAVHDIPQPADAEADLDTPIRITVDVDGKLVIDETYHAANNKVNQGARIFEQAFLTPGDHHVTIKLYDRPDATFAQTLLDSTITLEPRQALTFNFRDVHIPDPAAGERLYYQNAGGVNTGCRICHSLVKDQRIIGPSFYGIADRAGTRVPGMSAEEYLRQSILEPNAFVVPDYPAGQMVQTFGKILTEEEIQDLIAFLMTLKDE
jgi:cytochrome c2